MIKIIKIDCVSSEKYNYVKCPVCNRKFFSKPKNSKVCVLKIMGKVGETMEHLLFECQRCKNNYLITTDE